MSQKWDRIRAAAARDGPDLSCIYIDEHIDSLTRATQFGKVEGICRCSVCMCMCVCAIDTSDSIEYDSPRLSFNTQHTHATATTCGSPYSYTCRAWASTTLATRRSVCTLTAARIRRNSLCDETECRRRQRQRWHLPLYFDFILNARHAHRLRHRHRLEVGWEKGGYLVSWRCII